MSKPLRTASITGSVLLHLALLASLLLNPIKFDVMRADEATIAAVRSDLARLEAQAGEVVHQARKISHPTPATVSGKIETSKSAKTMPERSENLQAESQAPNLKPDVKPANSPPALDVTDLVQLILSNSPNAEPFDLALIDGNVVFQPMDNETASLISSPLDGGNDSTSNCDTTQAVQAAVQMDLPLKEALLTVPRSQRSVANVLMVWDGSWRDTPSRFGPIEEFRDAPALPPLLKTRIQELVRERSEPCLNQTNHGPTFIIIEHEAEPIILTIGSGEWRWADLIAPDALSEHAQVDGNSEEMRFNLPQR
jgi:hypothetical protein